ncbi:MDIS1-interacting receptor like kinase 2-like [Salvia splendens]|uniref:MDIS1-interacting receptor like kinase 2-like n=1 Tax=Salvia splendens TaxID=180675 RepID=UPI001C25AAF9|nr:MDIS1-interacting receptor like kinase 2-like [Salvia splendens]
MIYILTGEIPKENSLLNKLVQWNNAKNRLQGSLPREIGNRSAQDLWLDFNELTGPIPSTFVNQSSMITFSLRCNKLSGEIPPSICNLRSLKILYLSNNSLEAAIPDCLGNLSTSLLIFNSNTNKLTGLPSTFSKGCNIQSINLNGDKLDY